ncbi:hypothetical protein [Thaumasiovibrio subtropicus]|uniref:hypothetical protein n=1 Tax=Thaumasiovibrio subtropicus TaxID=1891207 RepID=UPI000B353C91|nr:hypothetical protein [Thaumasiovibrio subtropicus]
MIKHIKINPAGRLVIASVVLTNIVYAIMLCYTIPTLMAFSSGLPIFDMSPAGYNVEQATRLLDNLGETGRAFYRYQLALDLIYPALFGLSYFALFQWILNKNAITRTTWRWISILPIIAALFDYLENITVWLMLRSFPNVSELLVKVASTLTVTKSTLVMSYWCSLLVLLFILTIRKFKNRDTKAQH